MNKTTPCPTYLIEDTPAPKDAFASGEVPGPHQRVADAIADLIDSSENGGKVIGLEGGWGAGKSTVVGFLQNRFDKNDDYSVILFDAWAHEGDPLRRTYLETLIRRLQTQEWVGQAQWDRALDAISHRRRVTSTRTVPKPTVLGTLVGLSVFAVPFGCALVSAALSDGVMFSSDLPPSWKFICGSLLALGPFVILFLNLLWIRGKRLWGIQRQEGESEWNLLLSQAITETRTETVESPNPTSIEFEDHFTKLMQEALGKEPNRRLVLVLDNLDRVDPESALAIWSTLQTFLQERNHHHEDWFTRLWVVVPYDPNGLRKLWDNRAGSESLDTTQEKPTEKKTEAENRPASDSFLDKSFQVRFHVPPPVLSDWKSYLYELIGTALPDHPQKDRHLLYRVFDHCRGRTGEPPTPRELKLYVNQIGAIHRQWQHTFPVGHVAYFVLQRRTRRSVIESLRSSDIPTEEAIRFFGDTLQESLAGLAFNTKAEKGQELLLAEPIYQALANCDDIALKEIAERHNDGFWAVLEIVATSRLDDTDASTLSKAGLCLKQSALLDGHDGQEAKTVVQGIRQAAISVQQWSPFDKDMAKGVSSLCHIQDDAVFTQKALKSVASALSAKGDGEKSTTSSKPDRIVDALLDVLGAAVSLGHKDVIPESISIPVDVEGWNVACQRLKKLDTAGQFCTKIRPSVEFSEVASGLQTVISNGQFSQDHITTVRITHVSPLESSWAEVAASLRQRLDAAKDVPCNESHILFTGLCELRSIGCKEASVQLKDLADGGHILHHFHRATSENHPDSRAICAFTFLRERPGMKKPTAVGNSDAGHQSLTSALTADDKDLAASFITVAESFDDLTLLFRIATAGSNYPAFISECLRQIADSKTPQRLFTPNAVLERWKDLGAVLNTPEDDTGLSSLLGQLAIETDLCQSIQNREEAFVPEEAELYISIMEGAKEELPDFAKWCREGLEHMAKPLWAADLSGTFVCLRLPVNLSQHDNRPELPTAFSDALQDHASSLLAGNHVPPDDLADEWGTILDCMRDEGTRKVFRERLVDAAISQDGKLHGGFFEVYGDEIADPQTLVDNGQVVSHLFSAIIRERNVPGLRWLVGFIKENDGFLEKVQAEHTVQEFENRLRDCVTEPAEDEAQQFIDELADRLNVEPVNTAEETEDTPVEKQDSGEGKKAE